MIALCGDAEIGYDDVGSGLPVVFIHGFPHDRSLWAPQMGAFVDRCRCIAVDLSGFGESTRTGDASMDSYADDVACILDSLAIPHAVICGLSMGGYVAFAFWRRHRSRVRALILADTRATPDTPDAAEKRRELIALARAQGSTAVADRQIGGMVGKSTRDKNSGIVDTVYRMLEAQPVDAITSALEALIARPDSTPTLATIDVPTLIVVGEEDVLTPVKDARAMHAGIAGSRLEILAGAGHLTSLERPAAFNHVASEFLSRLTYE